MSFEEYETAFVWECDRCHLTAEFPRGSFWTAWDELKARGWRAHRDTGGGEVDWTPLMRQVRARSGQRNSGPTLEQVVTRELN
jgi:hypothetical protein